MGNRTAIHNIPTDVTGIKNEVIAQKGHRYEYDHAIRNCGARFVEVVTLADYEAAFTERTVMTNFFNAAEQGEISREDWVRVAHRHGVPCLNDAAADVPPISNLWNYTQMGFDLVAFSGGKGMRGPQNAGLLLGRKDLIDAATRNNNPNSDTVGRGMKVAKEQIVGMVAAVDWFLSQSDAGMEAEFRRRAERIAAQLKSIPTLESTRRDSERRRQCHSAPAAALRHATRQDAARRSDGRTAQGNSQHRAESQHRQEEAAQACPRMKAPSWSACGCSSRAKT